MCVPCKNDKAATLAQKYSAYTNTASFNAGMPSISVTNVITAKTVTLRMSAESGSEGWLTGYQIQRKNGKKYNNCKNSNCERACLFHMGNDDR